jgi:hypothetical protein
MMGDIYVVAFSPNYATDSTLFAGTYGGGVFNDPLESTPIVERWDMYITEKVKVGIQGYIPKISTGNYAER